MEKIGLYFHSSSKNHGCEAIVRSTLKVLKQYPVLLFSFNPQDDIFFNLPVNIEKLYFKNNKNKFKNFVRKFVKNLIPKKIQMFLKNNRNHNVNLYDNLLKSKISVGISIGGDNYCYGGTDLLYFFNRELKNNNKKTVLWGCSIEPTNIKKNKFLQKDLKTYSLITARESLTYDALIKNGINKNTHLFPDPAFLLDKVNPITLPKIFIQNNTVGINLSPMVLNNGTNVTYNNFIELILYILKNTNMNIALIPHVISDNSNDLEPLIKLYKQFKNTNRVCLIDENKTLNAMELKGIISQCRFMVASRTHASIAAYSTQVPTLVIGYSVKAKGIAKDIFGDYKDYVLPVQNLKKETEVTDAFKKLMQNEDNIRQYYKNVMPSYIEKTWLASKEVERLLN